jgi:hypothetical protein
VFAGNGRRQPRRSKVYETNYAARVQATANGGKDASDGGTGLHGQGGNCDLAPAISNHLKEYRVAPLVAQKLHIVAARNRLIRIGENGPLAAAQNQMIVGRPTP